MAAQKERASRTKRIPTGVSGLDSLIEGGFENRSTNLLIGSSGTGKSIFAIQFLKAGMDQGEKCLYVTFEERKEEVYANMSEFGWDLEAYEKKGLFLFLEYAPEKIRVMLEEGGGAIESLVVKNKITRIVIDSITSFELLFDKQLEKREAALSLFKMISAWGCTTVLTYEGDPLKESVDHKALEFQSDSIILLYYLRSRSKRERYVEILKMRGTKHAENVYKFNIEKDGIEVDKKPYEGKSLKRLY
jgi:circadian clock protein KaiC